MSKNLGARSVNGTNEQRVVGDYIKVASSLGPYNLYLMNGGNHE